jgi:hypothetical protein
LLFTVVCGLANYPIKHRVTPDPEHDLCSAMVKGPIFFVMYPASPWEVLLELLLLRVVGQANHVDFWAVVGLVA